MRTVLLQHFAHTQLAPGCTITLPLKYRLCAIPLWHTTDCDTSYLWAHGDLSAAVTYVSWRSSGAADGTWRAADTRSVTPSWSYILSEHRYTISYYKFNLTPALDTWLCVVWRLLDFGLNVDKRANYTDKQAQMKWKIGEFENKLCRGLGCLYACSH